MTSIERIKWAKAIKLYVASQPPKVKRDKRGFVFRRFYTMTDLARKLKVPATTVFRWMDTGRVSPSYRRILLENNIVKEYDL